MKKIIALFTRNKVLTAIVMLAALLRLLGIGHTPPSLNWDEVSHGYNAYSILTTGKDEWGVTLPSIFRAYGDYKLPGYIYASVVSVLLFGLNTFAVRLPSILAGTGTVVVAYFLVHRLFEKDVKSDIKLKYLSLLSAFLVAVEPWTFFISRGAFEANLALFFITLATYLFISSKKNNMNLVWSSLFFGLSVWTYNSARIFVPLFVTVLVLGYRLEIAGMFIKNTYLVIFSFVVTLLFLIPMFVQLVNPVGQARYNKVSLLDEGAIAQIEEAQNTSNLDPILARVLNNKGTYFVKNVGVNWISHISGKYLFSKGGTQYQFSVPDHGLIYVANATFLIIGVFALMKLKTRAGSIVLIWFFLGPIASSITREAPHVLRSSTMLPSPMIITAFGFMTFIKFIEERKIFEKKKMIPRIITAGYIFVIILSMENYLNKYFTYYRENYSWSWQYGYKEVADYIAMNKEKYDHVIITKKYGEPHEFLLFYEKYNPDDFRSDPNLNRFEQSEWFWVDGYSNYIFVNDWEIPKDNSPFVTESNVEINCFPKYDNIKEDEKKCLIITSPGNISTDWEKLETIYFLDKKVAFEVYTN